LVPALVTVFGVESVSAHSETLLLLLTCIWIIKEAVERLIRSPSKPASGVSL
jgi:Co/Zn/Cd efflux system component